MFFVRCIEEAFSETAFIDVGEHGEVIVGIDGVHRLLARQLQKAGLDDANTPPTPEAWRALLAAVGKTYEDVESERRTLERSVALFEREMRGVNDSLEAERDRMRLIFQVAPIGIIRTELDNRITMVNPAIEKMLGFSSRQLMAMDRPLEFIVHPDDRGASTASVAALWTGQFGRSYVSQRRLLHQDGSVIYANISASAAVDADGNPTFVIYLVEDFSEKMRLELELRHAQKLESVGRLASGIAHELNTPIQFIGDNAEFLQAAFGDLSKLCDVYGEAFQQLGAAVPDDLQQTLTDAQEEADLEYIRAHATEAFAATIHGVDRVSTIVKAMKAFAHPDQGQKAPADINGALRNTLTVGANEMKYVADLETDFGPLRMVECNLGDVNQVFLNLLVNAAHAISDVVAATGTKGKIRVRTYHEGDFAVVAICDSGTGIPEAIRTRIFDPFFTTKEVGRGTGQGLAISRSVIEKHGGTLTFETELGKGTTFFVRLPAPVGKSSSAEAA
jgi:PAS domain S-box-containing protein